MLCALIRFSFLLMVLCQGWLVRTSMAMTEAPVSVVESAWISANSTCFAHMVTVLLVFPGPRRVVGAFRLSPGLTVALGARQPSRLVQTQEIALTLLPHRTQNQPFPLGLFSQGYMSAICVFSPRRNLECSFVNGVKEAPVAAVTRWERGCLQVRASGQRTLLGPTCCCFGHRPSSDGTAGKTCKLFAN